MEKITTEEQEIRNEIKRLEQKSDAIRYANRRTDLIAKSIKLKAAADKLQHDMRVKPYADFMEAQKYVSACQASCTTPASNTMTGTESHLNVSPDRKTAVTFDQIKAGASLSIDGASYLVKTVEFSYGGSTLHLEHLSTTAHLANEPKTPFNGFSVAFNPATKEVIMSNVNRLEHNDTIQIGDKTYTPVMSGLHADYTSYDLREITNE